MEEELKTTTIENIEEIFDWNDIYGKKIPKPFGAFKVVYVKSDWYPVLKNFTRMEPSEFDRRTFWNSNFIWMTETEYKNIKYSVFTYDETPKYEPPKTLFGWFS